MNEFNIDDAEDRAKSIREELKLTDKIGLKIGRLVELLEKESNKKIIILEADFSDVNSNYSGLLDIEKDKVNICMNKNESMEKKRFTAAHEIGRFLLHYNGESEKTYTVIRRSINEERDEKELQADAFANELLMPANQIVRFFKIEKNTAILAEVFGVSRIDMKLRLEGLELI